MKERISTLLVVASVVAVPVLLAWYVLVHRPASYPADARVINLTGFAQRGVWTVDSVHNLNYWWKPFEPATLYLELNQRVVIRLHSADVVHQFYVPQLRIGPVDVEPGHVAEVDFRPDQEGVFQYYCTSLCGDCHFYMTGWIVVTAPGKVPPRPKPIVCNLCTPEPPPPIEKGVVAQGEYLYRRRGCEACHGLEGRGGVANYNYLNGEIIEHAHLAARLFLRDEAGADALVEWIGRRNLARNAQTEPQIAGFGIVQARLDAAVSLIREGKNAAKADLQGPEPPLQMPAWKHKLSDPEILSILAYLVTLNPWEEEEEETGYREPAQMKAVPYLLFLALEILLLGGLMIWDLRCDQSWRRRCQESGRLVQALRITDLAIWTEARYTRHPSQADRFTAFQNGPGALDQFPAGTWVRPAPWSHRAAQAAQ